MRYRSREVADLIVRDKRIEIAVDGEVENMVEAGRRHCCCCFRARAQPDGTGCGVRGRDLMYADEKEEE